MNVVTENLFFIKSLHFSCILCSIGGKIFPVGVQSTQRFTAGEPAEEDMEGEP